MNNGGKNGRLRWWFTAVVTEGSVRLLSGGLPFGGGGGKELERGRERLSDSEGERGEEGTE